MVGAQFRTSDSALAEVAGLAGLLIQQARHHNGGLHSWRSSYRSSIGRAATGHSPLR